MDGIHQRADHLTATPDDQHELDRLLAIVDEAGRLALGYFREGEKTKAGVEWKGDGSPVTEADLAVNAFLEPRLKALWPGAAWLSEESAEDDARLAADRVIVVDPIDGTRGFARGDLHWAISVALVEGRRPTIGVVHAPALGQTYSAIAGGGAWLNGEALHVEQVVELAATTRVTCPNNLADALRAAGTVCDFKPKIASLALRVVMVASGIYDAGFTARDSHEWDLAAADLVLQEAGGLLADHAGSTLLYNKADPSHGTLIAAARATQAACRTAIARTPFA